MKNPKRRQVIHAGLATLVAPAVFGGKVKGPTPDEIEGPFYPLTPQADQDFDLTRVQGKNGRALGEAVVIAGRILDVDGQPITGATVDIWQANAAGRYRHPHETSTAPLDPNFQGWAIVQSGQDGGFKFKTIIPGAYPVSKDWTRPPHIHFKVSKTGFHEVTTQMYFPGQALNDTDRLLQSKTPAEQGMMVAQKDEGGTLRYDVVLAKV